MSILEELKNPGPQDLATSEASSFDDLSKLSAPKGFIVYDFPSSPSSKRVRIQEPLFPGDQGLVYFEAQPTFPFNKSFRVQAASSEDPECLCSFEGGPVLTRATLAETTFARKDGNNCVLPAGAKIRINGWVIQDNGKAVRFSQLPITTAKEMLFTRMPHVARA